MTTNTNDPARNPKLGCCAPCRAGVCCGLAIHSRMCIGCGHECARVAPKVLTALRYD